MNICLLWTESNMEWYCTRCGSSRMRLLLYPKRDLPHLCLRKRGPPHTQSSTSCSFLTTLKFARHIAKRSTKAAQSREINILTHQGRFFFHVPLDESIRTPHSGTSRSSKSRPRPCVGEKCNSVACLDSVGPWQLESSTNSSIGQSQACSKSQMEVAVPASIVKFMNWHPIWTSQFL